MDLPVLFKHELESGIVARAKEYEIKAYHLLVEVEDDVNAFIQHGWHIAAEGKHAIELFKRFAGEKPAPPADAPAPSSPVSPAKADTKAATSKGKSAAK